MRHRPAAAACALVVLAACEHPTTLGGPALVPSPAAHATAAAAAVGAAPSNVDRATNGLAARVAGWERPAAPGPAPRSAAAEPLVGAAAFAVATPETLPAAARALDRVLRAATRGTAPR